MNTDERRGLPSASEMFRLSQCPGSHALIESLKKNGRFYEPPDPDREAGQRIHAWLAAMTLEPDTSRPELADKLGLAEGDLRTAVKAEELRFALVGAWANAPIESLQFEKIVETRFWFPTKWAPRFSGQADFVAVNHDKRRALVVNYKSGRKEAQPVADNLQLRTEIVVLKAALPRLEEVSGAIVEPWVSWTPQRVEYRENAFYEAQGQIVAIVDRAIWEADHRVAGEWCFHCPARAHCGEARDYISQLYRLGVSKGRGLVELPLGERGSKIIEDIHTVREILSAMEADYKRILAENPEALAEHYLHEGKLMRSLASIKAAREKLVIVGGVMSPEDFDACLDVSVAQLEQTFAAKRGLKLGLRSEEGEKAFAAFMGELVKLERVKPYIAKYSAKERQRRALVKEAREAIAQ